MSKSASTVLKWIAYAFAATVILAVSPFVGMFTMYKWYNDNYAATPEAESPEAESPEEE